MGDIKNLKALAKPLRNVDALPLDYYTVFAELEDSLQNEFDFVAEAAAMDRIYQTITNSGTTVPPLTIPRPVPGLVSRRVLVMDYLKGVPLSRYVLHNQPKKCWDFSLQIVQWIFISLFFLISLIYQSKRRNAEKRY